MRLARDVQHKDIALRVINQKMAGLRAAGYAGLPASGSFSDPQLNALQSASASTSIADYNADTKLVIAGVSWVGASTTHYLSETTLITKSGGL